MSDVSYRVGRHQGHNIYRVTAERPEGVQIGCMFDAADGPLVVAALNRTAAVPVAEFAHSMLQTGAAIALKHVGQELDAELADINARVAADKRVLDAAEAWRDQFSPALTALADDCYSPQECELYAAVDARRALTGTGPEVSITRPEGEPVPCSFCALTGRHTANCEVSTGRYE